MKIDLHFKSTQLLEKIANSIYDRERGGCPFTIKEIHVTEKWIKDLINEVTDGTYVAS